MKTFAEVKSDWEFAWNEWFKVCRRHGWLPGVSRVKCPRCFNAWEENGSDIENKPPVWPPGYENKSCPICEVGILSNPSIPF